jgi:hypothetical protein
MNPTKKNTKSFLVLKNRRKKNKNRENRETQIDRKKENKTQRAEAIRADFRGNSMVTQSQEKAWVQIPLKIG